MKQWKNATIIKVYAFIIFVVGITLGMLIGMGMGKTHETSCTHVHVNDPDFIKVLKEEGYVISHLRPGEELVKYAPFFSEKVEVFRLQRGLDE